ncbi:hypothetical protein BJ085DRAFT_38774 [Dimargaris cristalligena]|uniref:Nucleolar protein 12 n=1 Tax=Dimargaris cristalligena TaxID=215637 RepID=A0A4P9ZTA5_9FUNG|nr:hypothetical protein BJ085DRAFT_38774 [Dimargaris cristalligena]|eukprot:RKP36743.1 hypothetical protein BJ085DRAFT_38774 [Dimargaris cristalligena]
MTGYQPGQLAGLLSAQADSQLDGLFATSAKPITKEEVPVVAVTVPHRRTIEDVESDTEKGPSQKRPKNETRPTDPEADARTIFVGNVDISVLQDKKAANAFEKVFKAVGPVKAVRFRSIAISKFMDRKIAVRAGLLNDQRSTCNAYVVFAEKATVEEALKLNSIQFMDLTLRVDSVANPRSRDLKATVFVANLPFTIEEEAVRRHFAPCGTVVNVRLVRDRDLKFGKGVGYVEFKEQSSAGLALNLNDSTLEKRQIRVTFCQDSKAYSEKRAELGQKLNSQHKAKNCIRRLKSSKTKTATRKVAKMLKPQEKKFEGTRADRTKSPAEILAQTRKNLKYRR